MAINLLLEALQYAGRGWPVFAISSRKVPFKGTHGFKDATTDRATLEAMWARHPAAAVALATGDVVVIDVDGLGGVRQLSELVAAYGPLPPTLQARTPRGGRHLYFIPPPGVRIGSRAQKRGKGEDGLDIRGHGGLVLLPPSRGAAGAYEWIDATVATAVMPEWLAAWCLAQGARQELAPVANLGLGPVPAHLATVAAGVTGRALVGITDTPWSAHEEARLREALKYCDVRGHDNKVFLGFALQHLSWGERSDGTSIAYELWLGAISRDEGFSHPAKAEKKWPTLGKEIGNRKARTISSIIAEAKANGWDGRVHESIKPSHSNGFHALPEALTVPIEKQIVFPDTDKAGNPKATCLNTATAIEGLGVVCKKDVFHEKWLLAGEAIQSWQGDMTDESVLMLRRLIRLRFGFDPGPHHSRDAAVQLCLENQFNPVWDYLDGLQWDGRRRLGNWAIRYLGAPDTALNREIGRLMLIAAVRRARKPGTKFDQIIVLEGPQGTGKSTAVKILAGEDNFSDQHVLGADDRAQQEAFRGVWIHELAELSGLRRTEVERLKSFASRTEDRARPAFGHMRVDMKRRCVLIATTNEDDYLKDDTGNRRFWPIPTGRIDLEALACDRDQIWAEADVWERRGVSLFLDASLWGQISAIQSERLDSDPWEQKIMNYIGGKEDCAACDVMEQALQLKNVEMTQPTYVRVARILKRNGFKRYRKRDGKHLEWRYKAI